MVFYSLNFIIGMALMGVILLNKSGEINIRVLSIILGVMGFISLSISYIFIGSFVP